MHDLLFTTSLAAFEAAAWIKLVCMVKSWLNPLPLQKRKMWKSKKCLHKSLSKGWFGNEILQRRADAGGWGLTSFTVCDAFRVTHSIWRHKVGRAQNI